MKLAYCIPTANPALCSECFAAWREMGWDTFALVEQDAEKIKSATKVFTQPVYKGWGHGFNDLARMLDGEYDWLATGGDDCFPDRHYTAEEIGEQLTRLCGGTMGVAQAMGDRWAWDKNGTVDPICFAPFIGKEFAQRWNGGRGAFWPGYFQWFADNELRDTAQAAGLLWTRPDLTVEHRHISKVGKPSPPYKTSKHHRWTADRDLYFRRKSEGFPDSAPVSGSNHHDGVLGGLSLLPTG